MSLFRNAVVRKAAHLLASAMLGVAAVSAGAVEIGQPLPVATVAGAGATAVPFIDGKARVTYVDFWASWCGPCRQSFPWMKRMQERFGAKGLRIVAVNLDAKRTDAQGFLAQLPAPFDLGFDSTGSVARQFGVKTMPSSFLVGSDGKVIAVHHGFREEDEADLELRIVAALARP